MLTIMGREYLRTSDEFVAAEFGRVMLLFGQALPDNADRTTFERLTNEASAKGLNWVEALEYVAAKRAHYQARVSLVPPRDRF